MRLCFPKIVPQLRSVGSSAAREEGAHPGYRDKRRQMHATSADTRGRGNYETILAA